MCQYFKHIFLDASGGAGGTQASQGVEITMIVVIVTEHDDIEFAANL